MSAGKGNVVNTLVILFLIAISPFLLAALVVVGWIWVGVIASAAGHG